MKITLNDDRTFVISSKNRELFKKFKYRRYSRSWSRAQHRWIERIDDVAMYERLNRHTIKLKEGFIFYALNRCMEFGEVENRAELIDNFKSKLDMSKFEYDPLRPEQIEDVNKLLKFRYGILQCYTGYGKSEIMAVLVKNFIAMGMKVLVVMPNNPSIKEIRNRIKKYYNPVYTFIKGDSPLAIINPKALCNSGYWDELRKNDFKWFRDVDVVIADEVEMTLNASWERVKKRLDKAKYFYGFSASVNKKQVDPIPRDKTLRKMMNDQIAEVVANYGFTSSYRLPTVNNVTIVTLHTNLGGYRFVNKSKSKSKYAEVVENLFSYDRFQDAIRHILQEVDNLYVPINNLESISQLIKADLTDRWILTIQGSGIHIYEKGKHLKDVTLDTAKRLIAEGRIHAVFGTSSSFRALDFKKLSNVLATFGKATSVTIQYVGRVAREINMNVWYIESDVEVPIYTNTVRHNKRMVEDFYQNCNVGYQEDWC